MGVFGLGIDIEEVPFFRRLIEAANLDLLGRYFTPFELDQAGDGPNRAAHLAGRYAAKEAVLKALGIGLTGEIVLTDVEIKTLPSGAPVVVLHGPCAALADELGVRRWLLSISHSDMLAVANAIAASDDSVSAGP